MIEQFIEPKHLKDSCTIMDRQEIRHNFTDAELIEMKDWLFEVSKLKHNRELSLNYLKEFLNNDTPSESLEDVLLKIGKLDLGSTGLKSLKKDFSKILHKLNNGYEIIEQAVYGFAYYQEGVMAFYGSDGHFIYQRPLAPSERQTDIITSMRKIS